MGTGGYFEIEKYPADPLIGEAVHFRAINHDLFDVGNIYQELDWTWSAGETGAQYTVGLGGFDNDANNGHGFAWAHAYATADTFTATCTIRHVPGTSTVSISSPVTVRDPNDVSWDQDLYVDFGEVGGTPEFTWAPEESGNIHHVSSLAALQAYNLARGGNYRITFKDDETFTWNGDYIDISTNGTLLYLQRSGTGTNPPQIVAGDTGASDVTVCFLAGKNSVRVVIAEIDADGKYDPTTGRAPQGLLCFVSTNSLPPADMSLSAWRCTVIGMHRIFGVNGAGAKTMHKQWNGVVDCHITNWFDYGIGGFSSLCQWSVVGNTIAQSPIAILHDVKAGVPGAADHGPVRLHDMEDGCIENNDLRSASGWSAQANGYYIQPCIRLHNIHAFREGWRFNVQKNLGVGSQFCQVGTYSAGTPTACQPLAVVISRNQHWSGRAGPQGFVGTDVGGVYITNNIDYQANVFDKNNEGAFSLYLYDANGGDDYRTRPVTFKFNTVVSDRSATSGGNGNFDTVYEYQGTWPLLEEANNVVWVPNHDNSGSFTDYTELSRADNFKPVMGSAAIGAVSSGYPVRDYDGNLRANPTCVGAHHDSVGTDAGVTAPSNSAVPTFTELAEWAGEYALTGQGTWSNWTGRETYLFQYNWLLDGTPISGQYMLTVVDAAALSGELTVDIIATNLSGTRSTATSASTAV